MKIDILTVRALCERLGKLRGPNYTPITHADLARRVGIDPAYLSKIVNGRKTAGNRIQNRFAEFIGRLDEMEKQ
jgi:transcriptional regulator with XRE-family HTH domain